MQYACIPWRCLSKCQGRAALKSFIKTTGGVRAESGDEARMHVRMEPIWIRGQSCIASTGLEHSWAGLVKAGVLYTTHALHSRYRVAVVHGEGQHTRPKLAISCTQANSHASISIPHHPSRNGHIYGLAAVRGRIKKNNQIQICVPN